MDERKRSRAQRISRVRKRLGFAFLLVVILIAGAAPLLAWHPVIEADYECLPDGTYEVYGHASPWVGDNLEDRTNPDIRIHRDGYGGELVESGEFVIVNGDVPGFDWTDSKKYPGNEARTLTYVVVAMADWGGTGEEPRGADNLHRAQTTTVALPGTCVPQEIPGEIIVKKVTTVETDDEFAFTASWLTEGGFKLSNGEKAESGDLPPGTYSVAEVDHPDWTSSVVCDDESVPAAISLQPGETVTCTFTNSRNVVAPPPPTLTVTPTPTGAIGDWVWLDTDADGYQDDAEVGIGEVEVNLLNGAGLVIATTSTDSSGRYLFSGLPAGTYEVQFVVPSGFTATALRDAEAPVDRNSDAGPAGRTGLISLAAGQIDDTWDAGMVPIRPVLVLPQVITATTTTSTTVAQTSETLPFTGIADSLIGGVAVALVMLGGSVLLSIRRREQDAIIVADDWHSRLTVYTLKY